MGALRMLLLVLVALPMAAEAQRVPWGYGKPSDPLLESRFQVFEVEWRHHLVERQLLEYAPQELAGPVVDDLTGEIVSITRDGRVRLFTSTGRLIWENSIGAMPTGTPLLTDLAVYVGATDGAIHAIARFDGEVMWSARVGAAVVETPAVSGGRLFVGTDQDAIHAFDEETGENLWVYRRDTGATLRIRGGSGVSVSDGRVYAGFSDGAVVALAPRDGRILWEAPLGAGSVDKFPDSDATPVQRGDTLFVTVFNEGVFALDAATGRERWRADARGASSLTLDGDLLLVGGGGAWAFRPDTGTQVWRVDLRRGWTSQPVVAGELVLLAGAPGLLFVERGSGRPLRVFQPGSEFSAPPSVRGRNAYVLSNLGFLYALRITTR